MSDVDSSYEVICQIEDFRLLPFFSVELVSSDILILSVEILLHCAFLDDESVVYVSLIKKSDGLVCKLDRLY